MALEIEELVNGASGKVQRAEGRALDAALT